MATVKLDVYLNAFNPIRPRLVYGDSNYFYSQDTENRLRTADISGFTERLWAYLTIKKLLDKMIESTDQAVKDEAKAKALEMSLKVKNIVYRQEK